ncbi:hypothetical protein I350_02083 [Cryptococcus amylolentus CBS 6273]|uniref:Uncharacterized protein n=1 Tax=Cryptococcus amylolentus CBS 6273 TaxID=1296118 RepID=A0A1E3K9X8_9TREE|nr:hypothetical protein I350_02083 [Cryptococcus amylolentus CBS 6273]
MSLDPSQANHSRPVAPRHRKRLSSSISPRTFPTTAREARETTPSPMFGNATGSLAPNGDGGNALVLSELRQRSESVLNRAGREDVEWALREEWETREKLEKKVGSLEGEIGALEATNAELERALAVVQARTDEAFNEQARMEADLEDRDRLLDRLRKRVSDTERQLKDSQKRNADQEKAFETERHALQAQEEHLQKRLNTALSAARKTRPPSPTPVHSDTAFSTSNLKEELATLRLSKSALEAKFSTVLWEVSELREENRELKEENEGWEFMVRQKTLNGHIRNDRGFLGMDADGADAGRAQVDEALVQDTLDPHSPIKSRKGVREASTEQAGGGSHLAAEIGRAQETRELGVVEEGDEDEALRNEVKHLREAHKALSLYCSKIIDRIIAQEGFEQILSVDYKTRRVGSRNVSATQTPLKEIAISLADSSVNTNLPPSVPLSEERVREAAERKTRPMSMFRAFSSSTDRIVEEPKPLPPPVEVPVPALEAKAEKRARRGFSLDFRSLGFGGAATPDPPKPALRPLTLSSRATSATPPSEKDKDKKDKMLSPPLSATARKLEPQEEDEDDKRERHRMEASLKLMGIQPGNVESTSPGPVTAVERRSPWSRLYSVIGTPDPEPLSPRPAADAKDAEVALKEFHQLEAERIKALQQGKAEPRYTTPPKVGLHRRQSSSGAGARDRAMSGGSVRTLWSLGSSRPASQEIAKEYE